MSLLAALPGDESMAALLDRLDRKYVPPAMTEMLRRFPVRGVRLLSAAAEGAARPRGRPPPCCVPTCWPIRPPSRRRCRRWIRRRGNGSSGSATTRPRCRSPGRTGCRRCWCPRRGRSGAHGPPRRWWTAGLLAGSATAWLPGERERWAAVVPRWSGWWRGDDLTVLAAEVAAGRAGSSAAIHFFVRATEELARPLLPAWRPDESWGADGWMTRLAGRYELDALPAALHLARTAPKSVGEVLLPYADGEVADLMADWLDRLKTVRPVARSGCGGTRSTPRGRCCLRPWARPARAAGPPSGRCAWSPRSTGRCSSTWPGSTARRHSPPPRRCSTPTRWPSSRPDAEPAGVAGPGGAAAGAAAGPFGGAARRRGTPPLHDARHLRARPCRTGGGGRPRGVRHGLLTEFVWALFESWQSAGAPSKDGWAFTALGLLGDDSTARRLAPLVRAWPGESQHTRAVTGLEVLAQIGTDVALMHLYGISQKVKFRGLREQAARKVTEVADGLGLTPEQLGDRLVPDLGLDADGSLVLDYGPRRFTVGFDEQLKPYVVDGAGARRKDLPKPGARDDATLAPAAHKRFAGLKKDVRTLAADQIRRFESAMVIGRRWPAADFRRYFLSHPLLWHVVRRLVWATVDDAGQVVSAFRVAEDRTLADVDDEAYTLPDDATVAIAHPLSLGAAVPAWAEVFADYEILQPFPQLGREVFRLDAAERAETLLRRHAGVTVPAGRLLSLERRGWRRGDPQDAGIQSWLEREVPGGRAVVIDLDPGIAVGIVDMFPDQKIEAIWVNDVPYGGWFQRDGKVRLGDLDDVTLSEVLRDLAEVTR
ncbi:DUF4132 domain-containing protein [Micromonospora sp. BRA006-A]|nr:DUF4132 domain-containing protein [Micromonospora sp. BRA006-A]